MERFTGYKSSADLFWTYDHLISRDRVGSIRDPLIITTESGKEMVPATFELRRSNTGNRQSPLVSGQFQKALVQYDRAEMFHKDEQLKEHVIWDAEAEISILVLPLDQGARIFSARKVFTEVLNQDSFYSRGLRRLVDFFPEIDFGFLGSWGVLLNTEASDIDLFVYGGENFIQVTNTLRDQHLQKHFKIGELSDEQQSEYAKKYAQRFKINFERAKRIALLRSRYRLHLDDGREVKIAFSGCFDKREYQFQTALGSKKIRKIIKEGIALQTHNSVSFPREYIVEIASEPMRVISMDWVMQRMVEPGERVQIRGTLREKDGVSFISLEEPDDIIVAK